jgi:hypothetical protein
MRLAAMGLTMAAAVGAWGAGTGAAAERSVTVCMNLISTNDIEAMASRIFERVGVRIDWRPMAACPLSAGAIRISFAQQRPETEHPGAVAYALPYEGTHIVVYYDRVKKRVPADQRERLLAYVLVHEITHILQGFTRHSATGIMKAQWDQQDYWAMRSKALTFTADDEKLLHAGVDKRASLAAR